MPARAADQRRVLVVDAGAEWSTGACFVRAFRALGHEARLFDQAPYFPRGPSLASRSSARLARGPALGLMNAALVVAAAAFKPRLLLVMRGGYESVFVGTWARVELFERLRAAGLPLSIFGGGWKRLPARSLISPHVHRGMVLDESLRQKLTHAGAAICSVRKANRDLQTMRTFEILACEGFMVAERTGDHAAMFDKGREAVFFAGADELVETLRRWLPDEGGRRRIAAAGRARLLADGHRSEDGARTILDLLDEAPR
jgi:hypothetical protein